MKPDEAIKVLAEVCANFQGTLAQHQTIQTALRTLELLAVESSASSQKPKKNAENTPKTSAK